MNRTNLAYVNEYFEAENDNSLKQHLGLSLITWEYFVQEMKKVFRFSRKESKWFRNCKTAKLIATIPFAAECDEPERTAIAHLCIYIAELRGFQKYYSHLPSDDIDLFKRLDFISTFKGGNKDVIEYGMNLLALTMIEGYHKSEETDKNNGIYNPFVSGKWNYEICKNRIKQSLSSYSFPELDSLFSLHWN